MLSLGYGKKTKDITPRFGIGEWFGFNLTQLSAEERRQLAAEVLKPKKERTPQPCPFQARKPGAVCSKDGGVCSLRLYSYDTHPDNGRAVGVPVEGKQGDLRATCPYRFHDELSVFNWVGETILGDPNPLLVGEVGFLEAGASTDSEGGDDVGRIDMVLVSTKTPEAAPMNWAALEIQAVYFSGNAMKGEFEAFNDEAVNWVIFPAGRRRPDYRSSGPKPFEFLWHVGQPLKFLCAEDDSSTRCRVGHIRGHRFCKLVHAPYYILITYFININFEG